MENLKICGIVISALCVCVMFKNLHSEYSLFIRLIITVGISLFSIAVIQPVLYFINEISNGTEMQKYIPSLMKALGIAICVQITADVCKDSGEEALAGRVYLFGQAEILIISIPIIKSLLSLCSNVLK